LIVWVYPNYSRGRSSVIADFLLKAGFSLPPIPADPRDYLRNNTGAERNAAKFSKRYRLDALMLCTGNLPIMTGIR
jgi:hypothetical protein